MSVFNIKIHAILRWLHRDWINNGHDKKNLAYQKITDFPIVQFKNQKVYKKSGKNKEKLTLDELT